ncbi:iron complex transport system substrate-binding protein [Methanofollis sp. W23]|uniref:helical backbone metal receptor n=1 Tax=Methanofollis sp. W23 TaxID=2817849 RepID=UPI001E087CAF|nr:helical backbone metal receptor [Methanofollis sp. W23]MBP2146513.1 iron complex transport system substrate-binding protein [Methanofollis sp. W23]
MKKLCALVILLCTACIIGGAAYPLAAEDNTIQESLNYLESCQHPDGGFAEPERETNPGTSWFTVMAIVAAGQDPSTWTVNGTSAVDYWTASEDLTTEGTAELGRMVTLIAAVGGDPHDFGGKDYLADLKAQMKSSGQFGDFVYTTYWGIFGLVAAGEDASKSLAWLKDQQNEDGGFGWMPGAESDCDDTSASVMAMIAAGEPQDSPAVKNALGYLRDAQMDDGGFNYGGSSSSNAASAAWVTQAIVAAGVDPSTWTKNEKDVISYLTDIQQPDGSFKWTAQVTDNPCRMTAAAVPALLGRPYPILPGQTTPALSGQTRKAETTPATAATAPVGAATTVQNAGGPWELVTVTDDFGEKVAITEEPMRIVSLSPANTEILFALDLGDRMVGVTDYCNYPEEATEKPKVGGFSTVNIERVVAEKPDLVFAALGNTEEVVDHLRKLGLTVVTLNPDSVQGTLHDIRLVGEATGKGAEAETLAASMQKRINAVETKVEDAPEHPTVMHVVWYDPIWVSGNNTFQDELIDIASGENAFPDIEGWQIVTLEKVLTTDPDVILVNSGTGMDGGESDLIYRYFAEEPRFQNLKAVKNDRIYIVPSDIIDRGGPRIVDAIEMVAADIHPDLFGTEEETPTPSGAQTPGFGIFAALAGVGGACFLLRRIG